MVYENGRQLSQAVGMRLRRCILATLVASMAMSVAQAQDAALVDVVNLTAAMRIRDSVSAGLETNAKAAYPTLTTTQLTCVKVASVSHMVSSYATAIGKALTKAEVATAQAFYTSTDGKSYASKQLSTPPAALIASESAALNSFLATTAGQKLIKNKVYMTPELSTEIAGHLMWIVKGC